MTFARLTLRFSGDSVSYARCQAGLETALSVRVQRALLDWIPVSSRLCALRLNSSVCLGNC